VRRHPRALLGPYADGALPPPEAQPITEHLVSCAECRALLSELERGISAARSLPVGPLPQTRAAAMKRTLADAPIGVTRPKSRRHLWAALAAAVVLAAGGAFAIVGRGPRFTEARGAPIPLEELAWEEHHALLGGAALDFRSPSPDEVRAWLRSRDVRVGLASHRPGDSVAIEMLGAKVRPELGGPVGIVSYRVGSRPVTLVVTKEERVSGAPLWSPLGKRIAVRGAGDVSLLTWKNSGNAYTLVSGAGEKACFVCHSDPVRRGAIEAAAKRAGMLLPPPATGAPPA
jgi:anti-sigma factor RsiW